MSLSKQDGEKLTIEDVQTSSSSCRQEINTTAYDDYILISQTREKWNQEHFALTFPKTPMPNIKKRSEHSELEVSVPRQEKKNIEEGHKPTHVWINQFLREVSLKSSFSLAFITQAPFRYLYNPQNHYIMAETRKPKEDRRKTSKKKFRGKINSCVINLESMRKIINRKPEILGNTEKDPSKSPHKSKLPKKLNSTSETNLESNNSKKTLGISLRNDNKNSMTFIWKVNAAICCKDNPKTGSKKNVEEFSDEISECIHSSNMDLTLHLNDFGSEFTDIDEWSTNCSQNNAKKPLKKGGKKEKHSDIDSGDSKNEKKDKKKKNKKEPRKKKDTESEAESGDSKDGKKRTNKDEKRESKKKKDTDSTGGESVEFKVSKKDTKEKKSAGKKYTESSGSESVDSKGAKNVKKPPKKVAMKNAVSTDSESDATSKKGKKDEKKENKGRNRKPIKDTESTDADSESEGDSTGKKGEKKDKKITKKGEKKDAKKNAGSSGSKYDLGVKKEKKKKEKNVGSYTDSASDTSSKTGRRKIPRPSDTESEDSSEFRVTKTTVDSDVSSTDSKRGMSGMRRGYRSLSKTTTFSEKGKRHMAGRIPSSRERLPFPPCEPFRRTPKPIRVCEYKKSPTPPPKARYAPLPGVEWIHKLL